MINLKGSQSWQGSQYQSNKGTNPFNLSFDRNSIITSLLDKQPWKGNNPCVMKASIDKQ